MAENRRKEGAERVGPRSGRRPAPVELSEDQLDHVVGGLARPAVGREALDAVLEAAGPSEPPSHGG